MVAAGDEKPTEPASLLTPSGVVTREQAAQLAAAWHAAGEKVAFTNGCFDLLHVGHLATWRAARQYAPHLIVGVNSDTSVRRLKGPGRPINPDQERALLVSAFREVDCVVIFDELDASALVRAIRPDYYVKGGDYRLADLPEREAVTEVGAEPIFVPLVAGHSTTRLLQRASGGVEEY